MLRRLGGKQREVRSSNWDFLESEDSTNNAFCKKNHDEERNVAAFIETLKSKKREFAVKRVSGVAKEVRKSVLSCQLKTRSRSALQD